jgi:hypothetical protein
MLIFKTIFSIIDTISLQLPLLRLQPVYSSGFDFPAMDSTSSQSFAASHPQLNNQYYVKVFLIFDIGYKHRRADYLHFFTKFIKELDKKVATNPIFFNEDKALQYMRFIDSSRCVLTAYVPESAIEGQFDELSLKKGYLAADQIHGCYPCYAKGQEYLTNPTFNESLLNNVRQQEDIL